MSTVFVELTTIDHVRPHPNADRLEVAIIEGTTTVVPKGTFQKDQRVVFFPPDILIPPDVSQTLGVQKYLKHAQFPGDASTPAGKYQCRVAACRLRGEPSFGFVIPAPEMLADHAIGSDVSCMWAAQKYEPPLKIFDGEAASEFTYFHRYTEIEHYWRYPDAIAEGTPVRITEKVHGTNSRVGLVRNGQGEWEWMAGSHRVRRKKPETGTSIYWQVLDNERAAGLIEHLSEHVNNVILFGEIYGTGIQDMDYGVDRGYRVFDISVNGHYLNWADVKQGCERFGVPTVPLLYEGPFSKELVERFTYGATTLASPDQIKSGFKDREGCVITPLVEQFYARTGGRLILKSVSADYLDRKGAQDNE